MHYILPLGRGYAYGADPTMPTGICAEGRHRVEVALQRALLHEHAYPRCFVTLVTTAGREGKRRSGPTMAALTKAYLEFLGTEYPVIANTSDPSVWSTFAEIEWLKNYLSRHAMEPYTVEIVAAPRQDRRVRYILKTFFPKFPAIVTTSREAPIPLYHEAFGYLKLFLYRVGLRSVLDWLRRKTARPIAER